MSSNSQRVFDVENNLYALWSHSRHHGVFLGFASFQVSVYISAISASLYVRVRACIKAFYRFSLLYTWNRGFTCGWTWAELFFFGLCELQTNSASHISQTVGEDPVGPAAVCPASGITWGLWSHSATTHVAGKEWDDVMLFVMLEHIHLSDAVWRKEAEGAKQ